MANAGEVAAVGPGWVGEALNGAGQWTVRARLPWLFGLMMLFDSWDSVAIAYTNPVIAAQWKLSAIASGALISAGYGGQFGGALLTGAVADRRGRVPVLAALVSVMGVLALLCAVAPNYAALVVLRAVQGAAIGGALPVASCYINEIAPTATRGRFFGTYQFLMVSGFGLASLSSIWVVPHVGWRAMFALGALPLLLVPLLRYVPESPRWLASRGRPGEALAALARLGSEVARRAGAQAGAAVTVAHVGAIELLAPGTRRRALVTALLWFFTALVAYGLVTWIPSIYVGIFKIPLAEALRSNSIASISVLVLPLVLRMTIDRFGRRPPVILGTALGGLALIAMTFLSIDWRLVLIALSIVGQIGISISSMVLWTYTAEAFDTRTRSVALGSFSSFARGGSMLTPLLVGGVLQVTGSVTPVFWVFGLTSLAVALLWLCCTHETAGREIDG